MKSDENNIQESVGSRTQVAKNPKYARLKDKMLLVGVVLVCVGIGLSGLMPKRKTNQVVEEDGKENTSLQLNQNMALIAAMREKNKTNSSGYQGGDSMHPPVLRTQQNPDALTKETLARMNAPSTFF